MKALGSLIATAALAAVGAAITIFMWATMLETSAELLFVPITAALVIVKFIIVGVILPAALILVMLPLIAAAVAIVIPLTLGVLAIGAVCSLLITVL
jgi:hypothetical protein